MEVQSGGGFIEDEERRFLFLLSDKVGQLNALVLTTRQRRRILSELDVAESYIL